MPEAFTSTIAAEIEDYLALREASGLNTAQTHRHLQSLDTFLAQLEPERKELTRGIVEQWAASMSGSAETKRKRLSAVRGLAAYLIALGIPAYVSPLPKRRSTYTPYLFTEEELGALFASIDNLCGQSGKAALGTDVMPMLIRMLYGTGLRLGEALSLKWSDVDEQAGVLLIRKAKNDRQRYVPLSASLNSILASWRASGACAGSHGSLVFSSPSGETVTQNQVRRLFGIALADAKIANIREIKGQRGICPHCLRHQFTMDSYLKMEGEGRAFMESNPYLSAYLGHEGLACTDQYLKGSHAMHRREHAKMEVACDGLFPEVDFDEE
ncbi:MAG: tyrosine-type recombinase/integrase [Coriobacteriales bacterium]|nr:tyrosine-type recombinase/integrase [Coriobacteriales bacterium]